VEFEDGFGGGTFKAFAPVTVNVAGPWIDRVLSGSGTFGVDPEESKEDEAKMIGGTKGSHLVVDPFPGAPQDALYVEARRDGRPYFIVPWNGRYLIGTTDFRYKEDLDYVSADDEEIDYLIAETNAVVPTANLTRGDVLFTYSGVRPLPFKPEGSESSITRSHVVYDHATGRSAAGGRLTVEGAGPKADGLVSIVGGKLTTYRNLARQTVDVAYKKLGRSAPPCTTDRVPLPGGAAANFDTFSAEFKATSGLTDELAERLLRLYGARAPEVLEQAGDDPSLRVSLSPDPSVETGLLGCEVLYAFRREMAETLADALLRRTMAGLGPNVALDADEAAARVAVEHLGWTEERADVEVENFRRYVQRYRPKSFREGEPAGV
jgi:glycerol-3-phosphate dehydrogenase